MKILSFGEIIWDMYPDKKTLGCAPLNFAAHSVLFGHTVYLASAVGETDLGRILAANPTSAPPPLPRSFPRSERETVSVPPLSANTTAPETFPRP